MRWGLGPVFVYECLANSRRWQTYALRSAGVAALLCAMALLATSSTPTAENSARDYANLGEAYFIALIGVELALVMLAAPAATAGAICLDRARGTLSHMLMTDLSDTEIVLGKLAARLLPVFALVACSWPVMAISSLLGGIDPIALTVAFAIILAVAVLGCTLALAVSVWASKSHEVILTTYTFFILGLVLWPIWYLLSMTGQVAAPPAWALLANPFYVAFAPYADPDKIEFWGYLAFFAGTLGASSFLTILAVWRTRHVACRGSIERRKGLRFGLLSGLSRWLPGPSLDRNPVFWREWHRARPSRWMTAVVALLMGTTGVLCVVGAVAFWKNGANPRSPASWEVAGACSYMLHVIFGLLMLAAIAPTSLAEERQRGSLDILAATDLSTREIVIGKWLGTFRLVLFMAIGPGLMALAMATARAKTPFTPGPGLPMDWYRVVTAGARCYGVVVVIATILAHGALVASVGLAMAVWQKRQSRAIALSVGSFILVTAAWPIVVSIPANPDLGRNLASLSPVVTCAILMSFFSARIYGIVGSILWSGTFWAVEVFALAMGLLWLTVRTFDGCFDRMPDRPQQTSLRTGIVMILAGMIGAGSLVSAIDYWIEGVKPGTEGGPASFGIMAFSLLIAIGLVLVAVEAAKVGRPASNTVAPGLGPWRFVVSRWWPSFGLVLLLALGPAVLALALATARRAPKYDPQYTTNSAGVQVITRYVLAKADIPYAGEVRLRQRLLIAGLLIVTVLVHGGAAISVGLGLTNANGWTKRTLAIVLGLAFLAAFALQPADSLLALLFSRTSFSVGETVWIMTVWDVFVAIFTVALSLWTAWVWQRRLKGAYKAIPSFASDIDDGQPMVGTVFIGD